jgi:hypothetical protein
MRLLPHRPWPASGEPRRRRLLLTSGVVLETPQERFEQRFVPLLAQARELARLLSSTVDEHFPDGVAGDQFPEATAQRILLSVGPLYHAAVKALTDDEAALGALALMRPLIEAWVQLYFIMGTDDGADAACRAIRLEIGWARDTVGLTRAGGADVADQVEVAERRQAEIEALKAERKCKGGSRTYNQVDQSVRNMGEQYNIDWLLGAWRSSSQMTHVAGWDWLLTDQGDGTSAIGYPEPSHRAGRLNHLVVLFYNVAQTSLVVLGVMLDSDPARAIYDEAMAFLHNPFLARAIDGDFD